MENYVCSMQNPEHGSLLALVQCIHVYLKDIGSAGNRYFHNFPDSCCFFSTFFAALVIERSGFEQPKWVFGFRQSTGGHVWGECSGFLIDLTAGQYMDSPSEFIMYPYPALPLCEFHSTFEIVEKGIFDERFRHDKEYVEVQQLVEAFMSRKQ